MFFKSVIIFLFLGQILPEPLDNYRIIIIPIQKEHRTNSIWHPTIDFRSDHDKIDIEHYDEPTDLPDIDNFDYLKDKLEDDSSDDISSENNRQIYHVKKSEGLSIRDKRERIERDQIIKYLVGRSDGTRHFLHDDDDENDEDDVKIARSLEMSEDYDQYGENKIVGGTEVDINLYPYHVAYGTNCGGAIIDKKWAITAGHCGKKPYIRAGSKYMNQGVKIGVKHSYIHPEWPAKNKEHPFDYDFQLLELEEDLKFGENIQPVKIAHIEDMVIGKVITVTGWGNTKENGPYSTVLRAVRVPIISKENCQHVPFPYFRGSLTARMFCAGYSEGKKDACQGDSGGPAVSYDRLLGMVSFGYGCATPGSYGVYSKVAKVRPWIEEVTGIKLD